MLANFRVFLGVSVGGGPNTISSFAELKLVKNWGLWSKLEISGKSEIVLRVRVMMQNISPNEVMCCVVLYTSLSLRVVY